MTTWITGLLQPGLHPQGVSRSPGCLKFYETASVYFVPFLLLASEGSKVWRQIPVDADSSNRLLKIEPW